ncbi:OsmC family protein [Pelagibius sp. 7325]|uniref:OsmC family protein n=1 Tax=Pelagibius sp. 7325 TaxID=3131994 RepID=UPI0030EEF267
MPRGKEHHYEAHVTWTGVAGGSTKTYQGYSREYRAEFPGKPPVTGSADPAFRGDPKLHNPEDMLVLSLSACHMLSYLALAALEGLEVVAYEDDAGGTMQQEGKGGRFTEVVLRPRVTLAAGSDVARGEALHEEAHRTCFIANSVNFPVRHEAEVRCA